jgi:hypothetical protein
VLLRGVLLGMKGWQQRLPLSHVELLVCCGMVHPTLQHHLRGNQQQWQP